MERHPGRSIVTTYVHLASPGRYQARVRDARTGRDVKVSSPTIATAVKTARRKANRP